MPLDPIKVYNLDTEGVVVDTTALGNADGVLTKAQNAIPDPLGEKGSIRKRPGLKPFNTTAGSGAVQGGVGVPIYLGSAGPDFQNPFTDTPVTATSLRLPKYSVTTVLLGADFTDESLALLLKKRVRDQIDEPDSEEVAEEPDVADVQDDRPVDDTSTPTPSRLVPLVFMGGGTDGDWEGIASQDMAELYNLSFHYSKVRPNPLTTKYLLFPTGAVRTADGISTDALYTWWNVAGPTYSTLISGIASCVLNNIAYYIEGDVSTSGSSAFYTVGTDRPVLRMFDGYQDRIVARIPSGASTTPANGIVTLYAANNHVYLSTFDSGTGGVDGGTVVGSVYEYNPTTNALTKLGSSFPTGSLPFSMVWAYGRLWCGTAINARTTAVPGKLYWIRPGIDADWTLDKTFAASYSIVSSLAVFKGEIYAGLLCTDVLASTGLLMKRTTAGVWSTEDSYAIAANATGYVRGYYDVIVWPPEGNAVTSPAPSLYAVTGSGPVTGTFKIRSRASNGTWSITYAGGGRGGARLFSAWTLNSAGKAIPVLWNINRGRGDFDNNSATLNSIDGSTWVDRFVNAFSRTGEGFGLILQV